MSLHELIHGLPDPSANVIEDRTLRKHTDKAKTSKRKRKRSDEALEGTAVSASNDGGDSHAHVEASVSAIRSVYQQEYSWNDPSMGAYQTPPSYRESRKADKLTPRVRTKVRKNGETETLVETPEEARLRALKEERKRELHQIRTQWARRAYNYDNEVDIGLVVENSTREALLEKYRKNWKVRHEESSKDDEDDNSACASEDASVQDQNQVFQRLLSSQANREEEHDKDDDQSEDLENPYSKRWNYWQLGLATPRDHELDFKYSLSDHVGSTSTFSPPSDPRGLNGSITSFLQCITFGRQLDTSEQSRLPRTLVRSNSDTQSLFHRFRLYRVVRSRFLSSPDSMSTDEGRKLLLRLFHEESLDEKRFGGGQLMSSSSRRNIILNKACQDGLDLECWLSLMQNYPHQLVTRHLGVQDSSLRVSFYLDGTSLQRDVVSYHYRMQRLDAVNAASNTFKRGLQKPDMEDDSDAEAISDVEEDEGILSQDIDRELEPIGGASAGLPSCSFSHVARACPPEPFTSNILSSRMLIGPVDRYASYHHNASRIDQGAVSFAASHIIDKLLALRHGKPEAYKGMEHLLVVMLYEQASESFQDKNVMLNIKQQECDRYVNVDLQHAIEMAFAFVVNLMCKTDNSESSLAESCSSGRSPDETFANDQGEESKVFPHGLPGIVPGSCIDAAKTVSLIYDKWMSNPRGSVMPSVRCSRALARLTATLPEACRLTFAEASSSKDGIAVSRHVLEFMEESECIQEGAEAESKGLHVGQIEHSFNDAVKEFRMCLSAEPENVEFHGWHIGMLACSLLLSSGNYIGGDVCVRFPSARQATAAGASSFDHLPHERRLALRKYDHVRGELASAAKMFLELVLSQRSVVGTSIAISFLRWSQVIALLVDHDQENPWDAINDLHSLLIIDQLNGVDTQATNMRNKKLLQAATNLEADPSHIEQWRAFVDALLDANVDSDELSSMAMERKWWKYELLEGYGHMYLGHDGHYESKLQDIRRALSSLEQVSRAAAANEDRTLPGERDFLFSWLPLSPDSGKVMENARTCRKKERGRNFRMHLPSQQGKTINSNLNSPSAKLCTEVDGWLELACYKLLTAQLLFPDDREHLRAGVRFIVDAVVDASGMVRSEGPAWDAVVWLHRSGFTF